MDSGIAVWTPPTQEADTAPEVIDLGSPEPEDSPSEVAQATQQTRAPAKPSLKKRVLSGLPARKAPTKSKATTTPTRPTSALKSRAAASLTPRPKQRQAVEKIVAAVQITDESSSVESVDEFSSMPPTQATKPQSRLSRLWSKVVTASKKVITSPSRWFKRK